MKKFFKHLNVVIRHRWWVFYNCFRVGITYRGLVHDLSKFGFIEFFTSVKYVEGDKSPTIKERIYNDGFSHVAVRHTGRNRHHWQYWVDYDLDSLVVKKIPFKFALEYVCDIMAASRTYNKKEYNAKTVLDYFKNRKDHYIMHPMTKRFITECLEIYEKEGFKGIKKKKAKKLYLSLDKEYQNVIFLEYNSSWKERLEE